MTSSTSSWSVRRLAEEDWPLLRAVRLAMLVDQPDAYGSTFIRELAFTEETWRERSGPGVQLATTGAGLPVGTATLLDHGPGRDPEIVAMWVAGHARGSGVAEALVRACLEAAAEDGAEVVRLHVMMDNPRALAFYSRMGFVLDGECADLPGCARMRSTRPPGAGER